MTDCLSRNVTAAVLVCGLLAWHSGLQPTTMGQGVSSGGLRPFVVGIIPVVGPRGAIGGVSIDGRGALAAVPRQRATVKPRPKINPAPLAGAAAINRVSPLRKVSLKRLEQQIVARAKKNQPLGEDLQFLAGLQRVDYIFLYPEQDEIVLAGPAEGWVGQDNGVTIGVESQSPVLRLADLILAMRHVAASADANGISCSIDPTREGLLRLQRLVSRRNFQFSPSAMGVFKKTIGPHQVTVTGIPAESRMAQVMVAADYRMKRLAMQLEPSPANDLPSYMQLLQRGGRQPASALMPRWWLTPKLDKLTQDEEGLAWKIGQLTFQTKTRQLANGQETESHREARDWAEAFTQSYFEVSKAIPVFADLQKVCSLTVLATLLEREAMYQRSGCELPVLRKSKQLSFPKYPAARSVASEASLVRRGRSSIVSVSGGVQIDGWQGLPEETYDEQILKTRDQAKKGNAAAWWWD